MEQPIADIAIAGELCERDRDGQARLERQAAVVVSGRLRARGRLAY